MSSATVIDAKKLEAILDDGEPMRSVPKSVKEEGHKIIKVEGLDGSYRILIKKA